MSFRVNNKQLLKNYNKIWKKIEDLLNINFESRPVYGNNDKYIKTKIKVYADSIFTNSDKNEIPKKTEWDRMRQNETESDIDNDE